MFNALPTLGIGASLSLAAQPNPVALASHSSGPDFIEYAGLADAGRILAEVQCIQTTNTPVLFHPSYINFCGSFPNLPAWLKTTAQHIATVNSPWFAQDCAYCFWDEGFGYSSQFGYFIPPIFNQASLEQAIQRVREVQALVPVPVAIEPPPLTIIAGNMHLLAFFGELANRTDCGILLDMGHLLSYEMASGRSVFEGIDVFPLERVIEVHIAGGKIKAGENGPVYVDAHENPIVDEVWQMLDAWLPRLPNVKALCYECEGMDEASVLQTLARLRRLVVEKSPAAALVSKAGEKL